MPQRTRTVQVNVGTDLHRAHDPAGEAGQAAGDLRDPLTNTLLDVGQIGSAERRGGRRSVWSGAKQLVAGDARAAFKLVEVCAHLVL